MRKTILLFLLLFLLPLTAAQADILGVPIPEGATSVALPGLKNVDGKVKTFIRDVNAHPDLREIDLTGVSITTKNKAAIAEGCPGVTFLWEVKLGKGTFTTADTVMDLDALAGEAKLSEIAAALKALPNIAEVRMFKYRPSLNGMNDYLLSKFPDVKFGWTLNWLICSGRRVHLRSDATAFSTAKGRQDPRYTAGQIWERLQHFPDLLAIDVGHNNVSDLSFLANYPNLKRLICIDSKKPVTDISVLADLKDLEYIELFMQEITDISALADHTKLLDLNLCHNNVTDLSPLYSCTSLERLWISYNPGLTDEEVAEFKKHVPGCKVETVEYQSTGAGWREHPRYDVLIKSFDENTYYPFE